MTKYVYDEHFTHKDNNKLVKANLYMISQLHISTKFFNSQTQDESIATGIQVFLKNNYTNTTRRGVSDDYGQVTFYDVPAGDYTLTGVDKTGVYGDAVTNLMLNRFRPTDYDLILYTPFVPEANFRLIDSETNEPIEGLELDIGIIDGEYNNKAVSDSEGICKFKNVPTGNYDLNTNESPYYDHYYNRVEVNPAHYEFDCIIQSHKIKEYKVLVEDSTSETYPHTPIANANIKIHHNETGNEFTGISGEDGTYTFTNIINGQYTVSLSHQDFRANDYRITVRTQSEGEVEHLGMTPKYGNTSVKVLDIDTMQPIPEVNLKMVSADEGIPTLTAQTNDEGIAELENIYLGKYNILATNKYYDDTFTTGTLQLGTTYQIYMEKVELDNIKFKVVNKYGNKELLDHKEVQFFKKTNPTEEDEPDYTVEVEDGYTNTFIIPAGKYTVKFHDLDNAYDWISDEYLGQFPDKFLYNVDLNKTTQEQTYEWEGELLPELKLLCLNVGGGRVKDYKFHFESESPYGLSGFLTSDNEGNISIKHNVIYGSKLRVYCYDTGTHNNDIIFDEEFVIDTWDEDYVKEITIGARTIPSYALKIVEFDKTLQSTIPAKGGTSIMVKTSDGLSVVATVDGTNGNVFFNNILKEEDTIELRLNSDYYEGFYIEDRPYPVQPMTTLTTHFDNADTPDANRTLNAWRSYFTMYVLVRNKNKTSENVQGVKVVMTNADDCYGDDFTRTTGETGRAGMSPVRACKYTYTCTKTGWKTVTGTWDLTKNDADQTKIIDMECEIVLNFTIKDNFGYNVNSGEIIVSQSGGKTYTGTISNGKCTVKVNNNGAWNFHIIGEETDDWGNILHYDTAPGYTIPDNVGECNLTYTLTRRTAQVKVSVKKSGSSEKISGYTLSIPETGQSYQVKTSSDYTVDIPAGAMISIVATQGSYTGSQRIALTVGKSMPVTISIR